MTGYRLAHTADLDTRTLAAVRVMLDSAFPDGLGEEDWEHCLGGVHALVWEGADLVGHGCVVQRRLLHAGRAWRTGYVEGVAVRGDRRGRGHGATVMEALERVVRGAYDLGALAATDEAIGFYSARGWELWRGPSSALTPAGVVRTPDDDGGIFVLPVTVEPDASVELTCDWRYGDLW